MTRVETISLIIGAVAGIVAIVALVIAISGGSRDSALSAQVSSLQADVGRTAALESSLEQTATRLEQIVAHQNSSRTKTDADVKAVADSIAKTDGALAQAVERLGRIESDNDGVSGDADIKAVADSVARVESGLAQALERLGRVESDNDGVSGDADIEAVEADLRSVEDSVVAIGTGLAQALERLGRIESDEGAGNESEADLMSTLDALSAQVDMLELAIAPAATQAYVEEAIRRYNTEGRQETLDYYNTQDSVNGDLYLFVLDQNYEVIVHPTVPENIGQDVRGPLGTDITGYNFGAEFVTADEGGKWVSYVYLNPADNFKHERKNTWVVRHENLVFGSGWYERDVSLKSEPAAFTRAFVEEAIRRYNTDGRDATVAYYNTMESVDEQWYVFIGDENDVMIAHPTIPENVGMKFEDIRGSDGYPAGQQVLGAATEEGSWVDYTYLNPRSGNTESKHSWVVRHDGLIFGSGWYEEGASKDDPAAYTQSVVQRALNLYDAVGRDDTVAYYNTMESVDDQWYVFIGDENDVMIAHPTIPENVGMKFEDIRGSDGYPAGQQVLGAATEEGSWVDYTYLNPRSGNTESKHSWVVRHDGLIFGSGWYEEGASKDDPAAYTQSVVQRALNLYDAVGRDDTLAHYTMPESVDGQWYVFVVDQEGINIAHPTRPELIGTSTKNRKDVNDKPYGLEIFATTEAGSWVDYVFLNPSTGEEEQKHTWVVRHDGLIFGSGWYE